MDFELRHLGCVEVSPTTVLVEVEGTWTGPRRRLGHPILVLEAPDLGELRVRAANRSRDSAAVAAPEGGDWRATYPVLRRVADLVAEGGTARLEPPGEPAVELPALPVVPVAPLEPEPDPTPRRRRRRRARRGPRRLVSGLAGQGLIVLGAVGVAVAAAGLALAFVAPRPQVIPALVGVALVGAFLLARPAWVLPAFIALTWSAIGQSVFGGLSPVELGGAALLGLGLWRAMRTEDAHGDVLLAVLLIGLPLAGTALMSADSPGLPKNDLRDLSFIAIVALSLRGFADVERMTVALGVCGIVLGAGAMFSVLVHPTGIFPLEIDPSGAQASRAAGPFGEPNLFALSLAAVTPFALHLISRGGWARLLGLVCGAALAGGIFATGSRGALLATGAGLVVLALAAGPRVRAGVLVAVVLAAAVYPLFAAQSASSGQRSVQGRVTENRVALAMWQDQPLVGVGPGAYPLLYRDYTRRIGNDDRPVRGAHSLPLEIAAEQGLAGILGWLGLGLLVLAQAFRRNLWQVPVARTVLVSMLVFLVGSLFLQGDQNRILYMLVGTVLAMGGFVPARFADERRRRTA